jgi:hypothetical protein
MKHSALRLAGLFSIVLLSCAEGFGSGEKLVVPILNGGASGGGSGGSAGQNMSGAGGTGGSGGAGGAYTGMPCTQGDAPECECPTGGSGTRICRFDANSPTMGTFAECTGCVAPSGGSGGTGGSSGDAASGSGGTGGRSGSGGGGGSGGAGSGGSSGAGGGSSGTGGSSSGGCPASGCTNSCFPVGVLACCTDFGTCGCTWAPGAYCF